MTTRLRREMDRWKLHWLQVDSLLDQIDSARDEDRPYAMVCDAVYEALRAVENMRLRRHGRRLVDPLRFHLPDDDLPTITEGGSGVIIEAEQRAMLLPGPLEVEMAIAGLLVEEDEDGEVELIDPLTAVLAGSQDLFAVWDDDKGDLVPYTVARYDFGLLKGAIPSLVFDLILPGSLSVTTFSYPVLSEEDKDDLFPEDHRRTALYEGYVELPPWDGVRATRLETLMDASDDELEPCRAGRAETWTLSTLITVATAAQARTIASSAATETASDISAVKAALDRLSDEEPEEDAIPFLEALIQSLQNEKTGYDTIATKLTGSVSATDLVDALSALGGLPDPEALPDPTSLVDDVVDLFEAIVGLTSAMNEAVSLRIAWGDGTARMTRVMEQTLRKLWRHRMPWFVFRHSRVLWRRFERYMQPFLDSFAGLVQQGNTGFTASHLRLSAPLTMGSVEITLQGSPSTKAVRAGQLAIIGGARSALVLLLGVTRSSTGERRLRIGPLKVSGATGRGIDGIPGMVTPGNIPLRATLEPDTGGPPVTLTGRELVKGARDNEPEDDAIPQEVVAHWSRLCLLMGRSKVASLPSPFNPNLTATVYAKTDLALPAFAAQLVLLDPSGTLIDDSVTPSKPKLGVPGEIMLLRGQDAAGQWWQGAVEVNSAQVTTLQALEMPAETSTDSPVCCQDEDPVVLLTLLRNPVPEPLVSAMVHRWFQGFGPASLATRAILPEEIDPVTVTLEVTETGVQTLDTTLAAVIARGPLPSGTRRQLIDRKPELDVAAALLDSWIGEER